MKKFILFTFLFISFSSFAQDNELSFSIPFEKESIYENSFSVNYFKQVSHNNFLGLKTRIQWFNDRRQATDSYLPNYVKSLNKRSFELVNRWKSKSTRTIRYYADLGITLVQKSAYEYMCYGCHRIEEEEIETTPPYNPNTPIIDYSYYPVNHEELIKSVYWGFSSSLGAEMTLFKKINFGLAYNYNIYFENNTKESLSNFSLNLGYLF